MIEDAEEIGNLACFALALVTGVFVGSITTDKKLVRECSEVEAEDMGRGR